MRPGSSIARKVSGTFLALTDLPAGKGARDDEALDLAGALEDRVDLGVAVPALDGVLAGVAVAAEDLDRFLRHPHGDLAGLVLAHRALGVAVAAVAGQPRGAPDEQAARIDLGDHVRQLERDRLVQDDRPAERPPLLGVVEGELVGRPGDAERLGAHGRTGRLERRHGRLPLARVAGLAGTR